LQIKDLQRKVGRGIFQGVAFLFNTKSLFLAQKYRLPVETCELVPKVICG